MSTSSLSWTSPGEFAYYDTSSAWAFYVRDDTTQELLGELQHFHKATIISRFNDVGSWEVETGLVGVATELVRRGKASLVVRCGDQTVLSGPLTRAARTWDERGENMVVNGASDLIWPAVRAIRNWGVDYIDFAGSFPWVLAEILRFGMHGDMGAPPGGLPGGIRGGPTVTIPGYDRGTEPYPCSYSARWEPALPAMQTAARQSRPVYGFDIRDLTFEAWLPSHPGTIFSAELGTMGSYELVAESPDANTLYVLGKREGRDRQWRVVEDGSSRDNWWRFEDLLEAANAGEDAEELEPPEGGWPGEPEYGPWPDNQEALELAGREALAEKVKPVACKVTPIDTPAQQFGLHYGLGDQATVVFADGVEFTETITEVTITLEDNKPLSVIPTVGQPQMTLDTFRRLDSVERRLRKLEQK